MPDMAPIVRSVELPNHVTIPYVEQGDSSGVPVVLLHAIADSWRSFKRVLPRLPDSLHAFALTKRGHGDASRQALCDRSPRPHPWAPALGLARHLARQAGSPGDVGPHRVEADGPRDAGFVRAFAESTLATPEKSPTAWRPILRASSKRSPNDGRVEFQVQ
jgi:pimeloyl-ACP methyl ester carboxylesterase